ncbi:MAG: hypothetical protein D6798_16990 [Deltaproteobacteria bacterium]|nr:MAG: hypothetical protein D6798_16990 [Deltaproteobacteria bacterium]
MEPTPGNTTEALFRAAVHGDAERARQLIFAGAQPCRFEEGRVTRADEVACAAGNDQVAAAIRRALAERSAEVHDGRRRALLARCVEPEELVQDVLAVVPRGDEVLVTEASVSPAPDVAVRLLVWKGGAESVQLVGDAWVRVVDRAAVVAALGEACRLFQGGCDAMATTVPRTCWATEGARLRVWVNGRMSMAMDERRLLFGRGQRRVVSRDHLEAVQVRLSRQWDRHAVEVVLRGDRRREVAARREHSATLDPTYDRDNLVVDAAWAVELAQSIGMAGGVPVRLPDDLS